MAGMRGSMVVRPQPCIISSTHKSPRPCLISALSSPPSPFPLFPSSVFSPRPLPASPALQTRTPCISLLSLLPPRRPGSGRYCRNSSLSIRVDPPLRWHRSLKVSLMSFISHWSTVYGEHTTPHHNTAYATQEFQPTEATHRHVRKQHRHTQTHTDGCKRPGHMTGPNRTKQVKTGQDITGQDKTGQDRTGPDRRGRERTRQDKTGPDKTGQDRTGRDRAGQRTGQDGHDRT